MDWDRSLRPATAADAEPIGRVNVRCWRTSHRSLVPAAVLDSLRAEEVAAHWRRQARRGAAETWVAEDGAVVGYASFGPSRDRDAERSAGEVYALYVDPVVQGRGAGRALVGLAAGTLRAQGYALATLWVLERAGGARAFYEAAGWAPDGGMGTFSLKGHELPTLRYRLELGQG